MNKKTAINILIFVVVVAIAVVVYLLFFQQENGGGERGQQTTTPPLITNFFPEAEVFQPTENDGTEQQPDPNFQPIPKLRRISGSPTAGFLVYNQETTSTVPLIEEGSVKKTETETVYRFVNRSNGNILETNNKKLFVDRITNTTIPTTYEVFFLKEPNSILFRTINDADLISSTWLKLVEPAQNGTSTNDLEEETFFFDVQEKELVLNIKNIVVSPDKKLLFYTTEDINNNLNGYVLDLEKPELLTQVFSSEIKHSEFFWPSQNTLIWGTKPSQFDESYLFEYDLQNKNNKKIIGAGPGFNFIVSPDGNSLLFSQIIGSSLDSFSYFRDSKIKNAFNLNTSTIVADKCVWSQKESDYVYCGVPKTALGINYPAIWYRGEVSLNDDLYKINVISGSKTKIEGLDGNFDIIKPQLSEDERYFVFINKKDLSLWSLDLVND